MYYKLAKLKHNMNEWQKHPKLKGRFSSENPDDVLVLVHDGGPRFTKHHPELVWVRVTGEADSIFTGIILNQPEQLTSIKAGSIISFLVPDGGQHPIMVTQKYIQERSGWIVYPCKKCGLTELFDAPSDLNRVVFPNSPNGAITVMSTVICGGCGGSQGIQNKNVNIHKWWQFWK